MKEDKIKNLVEKFLKGDRIALSRVISLIDDRDEALSFIIDKIYPFTGNAFLIGITGPPGAGKSTLVSKLVSQIREKTKEKVAVVAIDPSSPFTGGALLGDRIRMQSHFNDPDVFIRSLGTRGSSGGISLSSKEVVMALDAFGFKWILVETAGVGQTELDVLKLTHLVAVVLVPESGDGIQVMKAGLMEIADLFIVNKSDRPQADNLVREILSLIDLKQKTLSEGLNFKIPVIKTEAIFDKGIDELLNQIIELRKNLNESDKLKLKQKNFLKEEVFETIKNKIDHKLKSFIQTEQGQELLESLYQKKITPFEAVEKIYLSIQNT
jgi:LAO/AO transport system kinase